jgi:hypothetical protein
MTPLNVLLFVWVGVAGIVAMAVTGVAWLLIFGALAGNVTWRILSRAVIRLAQIPFRRSAAAP